MKTNSHGLIEPLPRDPDKTVDPLRDATCRKVDRSDKDEAEQQADQAGEQLEGPELISKQCLWNPQVGRESGKGLADEAMNGHGEFRRFRTKERKSE